MQNFDDYLEEQFQNKDESKAFINAALEQYFEDHNKELFLATLKVAIKNSRRDYCNFKTNTY